MTISFNADRVREPARWAQIGFLAIAVLFNLCLVAQLLAVGLAIFQNPVWWNTHVWLGRGFGVLGAILLFWVFLQAFPRKIRMLTVSLTVLLSLQFLTIHLNRFLPLGIFHPFIGFSLFTVSTTLVHHSWRMVFPKLNAAIANELNTLP